MSCSSSLIDYLMDKRFIIVSGKGGVGKTTIATAMGLGFTKVGKKVLVVSIDPAHSLGDVLELDLKDRIVKVTENFYALEFNPLTSAILKRETLDNVTSQEFINEKIIENGAIDKGYKELINKSDEPYEFAEGLSFIRLMESLEKRKEFDVIIFDTAPSGHTLELLRLPKILDGLYGKILKLRLNLEKMTRKIKGALTAKSRRLDSSSSTERLIDLYKTIKNVIKILNNESMTELVVVTIPNNVAILETKRLIEKLAKYGIPNRTLIINFVRFYTGNCKFCSMISNYHLKNLRILEKHFNEKEIWTIPYFRREIRGLESLNLVLEYLTSLKVGKALRVFEMNNTIE